MAQKNIIVFMGSVRPNRMGDRVLTLVKSTVEGNGMKATVFDPMHMPFELVKQPLHFMPNQDEAPGWLKDANKQIIDADGFLIVSAEYNCSLPPALSNMLDHFPPASFRHRPVGLIGYSMGNFGGIRALTLLRAFVAEFGMLPMPTNVPIPLVQNVFSEDGVCSEARISNNITKVTQELSWYADAIKNHKKVAAPSEHSFI